MDDTANLGLPYLAGAQAQKHVTLNESLRILDTLVQAGAVSRAEAAPPPSPAEGSRYIVPGGGEAAWGAPANVLAARLDGAWRHHEPREGWLVHVADEAAFVVFRAGAWEPLGSFTQEDLAEVPLVGVGTRADDTNRLAVASPATLLTHAGSDHRVSVNRAGVADTASLLFQTDHSARAEIGLAGEDAFCVKVSPDGTAWATALRIDPSGRVEMPERPAVRAHLNGGWRDVPSGGETGFAAMATRRGGFALGSTVADAGRRLLVPATGTYLAILQVFTGPSGDFRAMLRGTHGNHTFVQVNESDQSAMTQASTTIVDLEAGEELSLRYQGQARCFHAVGHTELSLVMI